VAAHELEELNRRIERLERKVAGQTALNLLVALLAAFAIVMAVWWIPANTDAWNRNADILERVFPEAK